MDSHVLFESVPVHGDASGFGDGAVPVSESAVAEFEEFQIKRLEYLHGGECVFERKAQVVEFANR